MNTSTASALEQLVPIEPATTKSRIDWVALRLHRANQYDTSPDILRRLSFDSEFQVRLAVSANPNTPIDVLFRLADDRDANVAISARYYITQK